MSDDSDTISWIDSFYADVDAQDTQRVLDRFAPDGEIVFGGTPPAIGHPAVREVLENLRAALTKMEHEWRNRWQLDPTTLVLEARVRYFTRGGAEVLLPCVTVIERTSAGLITSLRIHIDAAVLFATLDTESVIAPAEDLQELPVSSPGARPSSPSVEQALALLPAGWPTTEWERCARAPARSAPTARKPGRTQRARQSRRGNATGPATVRRHGTRPRRQRPLNTIFECFSRS
ncbi:nuclear transport factor 2 family protein [Streptomyces sp. NBC_01456]|uniref:nuclear transport factor 2 family protein n=1 Tax=unclassified Streptomyces TaxID=2593676 RepID=UPI002E31D87A|nr:MULTISPECIES: nuclear transport factor 2 family protein [unclassified Streptomyces]